MKIQPNSLVDFHTALDLRRPISIALRGHARREQAGGLRLGEHDLHIGEGGFQGLARACAEIIYL